MYFPSDSGDYGFRHLLTRDAAYKALLASNRRKLHGAAADALAQRIATHEPDELSLLHSLVDHLAAAERWAEAHAQALVLLTRETTLGQLGNWERIVARAEEYWELARRQQPQLPEQSVGLCNAWSFYHAMIGQSAAALARGEAALALARAAGDREQAACALMYCGIAAHYAGDHLRGLELYRQAREEYRALHNVTGELRCLNNIGLALHEGTDSAAAEPYLAAGLELAMQGGSALMLANLAVNMGLVRHSLGQIQVARECFELALTTARRIDDRSTEGMALGNLAELAAEAGELDVARTLNAQALALAQECGSPRFIVWWTRSQAHYEAQAGDLELAWATCQRALATARSAGDNVVLLHVLISGAQIALEHGDSAAAIAWLDEADLAAPDVAALSRAEYDRVTGELRAAATAAQAGSSAGQPRQG